MTAWGRYKCPYCGKETDHFLIYMIHIVELHKEEKAEAQPQFSFSLSGVRA
ncbi:hypothetical protein [Pyrococcus kukulkanii]|uniref:hypothetical protein n=1 Tax=Pyrococcus kukulkanii TaxID=1609559 RepID=UPI003565B52D